MALNNQNKLPSSTYQNTEIIAQNQKEIIWEARTLIVQEQRYLGDRIQWIVEDTKFKHPDDYDYGYDNDLSLYFSLRADLIDSDGIVINTLASFHGIITEGSGKKKRITMEIPSSQIWNKVKKVRIYLD